MQLRKALTFFNHRTPHKQHYMSHQQSQIEDNLLDTPIVPNAPITPPNGKYRILNDSSVYFKGLFGMIFCIIPSAILGLVLVKISLEQAKVALKEYDKNPSNYRLSSLKMLKRGRTFAYIGLTLFIVELIALMAYMSI